MNSNNNIEVVQNLLAFALVKEKSNLIDLLRRNGIDIPYDANDDDVLVATLNASVKSKYFKDELSKFLADMTIENKDTFTASFTGEDDEEFFNWLTPQQGQALIDYAKKNPTTSGTTGTKTTTSGTTGSKTSAISKIGSWLGKNIFTPENIQTGIGLGLTALNNKSQKRADDAAANLEQIRTQKLAIESQTGGGTGAGTGGDGKGGKNKTIMWVLVGVGVLALATGVFFIVRKKGTTQVAPAV